MQWIENNIVGILGFLGVVGVQSIGLIIWLTRLDDRVMQMERVGPPQLVELTQRLARQEERLIALMNSFNQHGLRLDAISSRLDRLIDMAGNNHNK